VTALSLEILIVLMLMVRNDFFAMSEIAMVSARKSRLQQWANEDDARALGAGSGHIDSHA
jgi:putative hemolysin